MIAPFEARLSPTIVAPSRLLSPVVRRRRKVDFNIDEVGTPESIQDVVSVSGSWSGNAADDGDGDEPDPPEELERYL